MIPQNCNWLIDRLKREADTAIDLGETVLAELLREAADEIRHLSEWQSIESAPKDEKVIVYQPQHKRDEERFARPLSNTNPNDHLTVPRKVMSIEYPECISTAVMDDHEPGLWWSGEAWDSEALYPTHWMPLPKGP